MVCLILPTAHVMLGGREELLDVSREYLKRPQSLCSCLDCPPAQIPAHPFFLRVSTALSPRQRSPLLGACVWPFTALVSTYAPPSKPSCVSTCFQLLSPECKLPRFGNNALHIPCALNVFIGWVKMQEITCVTYQVKPAGQPNSPV